MKPLMIMAAAMALSACATNSRNIADPAADAAWAAAGCSLDMAYCPCAYEPQGAAEAGVHPLYQIAIIDPRRPSEEVARDPLRYPAAMLEFIDLRPNMRIADIRPEEGYFSRLFASVVCETGRVYAFVPNRTAERENGFADTLAAEYGNVERINGALDAMTFPEPLDVVFMGQEYHDFHIAGFNTDVAEMNRRVFAALRPGGVYIVLDHSGRAGTGNTEVQSLHRIEGAFLRREIEAAGFIFDGELTVLANPDDDRTRSVFDEAIRGRTDQFVYRFRKPE